MVVTAQEVIVLYVATFKRAPDTAGLDYWVNDSGLNIKDIAASFFVQPETKALYPDGTSTTSFINSVYRNLFNRDAENAGLVYWKEQIDSGAIHKSVFIQAVINGALDTDAIILENKKTVAQSFVDQGLNDTDLAKQVIENIDDTTDSVENALELIHLAENSEENIVNNDTQSPSLTITDDTLGIATDDVTYTFTFDEDVIGFTSDDINLSGGDKSTFTQLTNSEYTLVVIPHVNSMGLIIVNVPSGVAVDTAGNSNLASQYELQAVDTTFHKSHETEINSIDRYTQPYIDVGIVFTTFSDGYMVSGTASMVGENDVLTATHVVYSPDHGGWAESLEFYFGADYNDVTNSFEDIGYYYSPNQMTFDGFDSFIDNDNDMMTAYESQYDITIVGLDSDIGNDLGWLGLDSNYNYGIITAEAIGYPNDATGMMSETITVTKNLYYDVYHSDYPVFGPGSSGGPLVVDNYVIGVMSAGDEDYNTWADISSVYDDIVNIIYTNDYLL